MERAGQQIVCGAPTTLRGYGIGEGDQRWKLTKYIYSSNVLKYNFEVFFFTLLEYFLISVLLLLLHYISEASY